MDNSVWGNMNCGDSTQHFGKKLWLIFIPVPLHWYLHEAQLKTFRLMALTEEISGQPSIGSVLWLLEIILMQICNEKEQAKQGKLQNVQFEEERNARKCHGEKSSVQEQKHFKDKPDSKPIVEQRPQGQTPPS